MFLMKIFLGYQLTHIFDTCYLSFKDYFLRNQMSELKRLFIEPTAKTPEIDLGNVSGELIFSGKSIPENAANIYEPVLNWVSNYILNPRPVTNLRINFEYFNTVSTIWLTRIFKVLAKINDPDYILVIHLYLPIEDYEELREFDDIRDAFLPISVIISEASPSVVIKLYGTDNKFEVVKDSMVFV